MSLLTIEIIKVSLFLVSGGAVFFGLYGQHRLLASIATMVAFLLAVFSWPSVASGVWTLVHVLFQEEVASGKDDSKVTTYKLEEPHSASPTAGTSTKASSLGSEVDGKVSTSNPARGVLLPVSPDSEFDAPLSDEGLSKDSSLPIYTNEGLPSASSEESLLTNGCEGGNSIAYVSGEVCMVNRCGEIVKGWKDICDDL